MAHFYGKVRGQRGPGASRLGSRTSGLVTVAASWQGAVEVTLYTRDGADYARVELMPWHGAGTSRVLYDGRVDGSGVDATASED